LNLIKKKLEKNPTLTTRPLKMRMTHSSVEEEEWSSQQAVCCHLGPHEEEDKEESVEASETRGTTALVYCLISSGLYMYRYCTRVVEYTPNWVDGQ
jgi:hypothetical protein